MAHTCTRVCVRRMTYLGEEDALWLHLDHHAVSVVLNKLFKTQELHGAQLPPVLPVDAQLQLTVLTTHTNARDVTLYARTDPSIPSSVALNPLVVCVAHLIEVEVEALVPALLITRAPRRLCHLLVVQVTHCHHFA